MRDQPDQPLDSPATTRATDFPDHFGFFLPLAGISTVKQIRESAFDIRATSRLNRLYLELITDNPDWGVASKRPDMNHFMARLIFCFFAKDTDTFVSDNLFTATIADLYKPEKMLASLRVVHDQNVDVLERIYIGRRFRNDTEPLENCSKCIR